MTVPTWIEAAVREFGRGAGLADFALNARGAAAFRFANGVSLRFEYTDATRASLPDADGALVVAAAVAMPCDPPAARRILACAHPDARYGVKIRAGYLAKPGCAVFAVRLAAQDVTLPVLNTVFGALWRVATEAGGAA